MRKVKDVMAYAIDKCRQLPYSKSRYVRVYAVVTNKRNKIIAEAGNDYNSSCRTQRKYARFIASERVFSHAECQALNKVHPRHKDQVYKIYIARVYKDGTLANAKPCPVCSAAIKDFGVSLIEHTL